MLGLNCLKAALEQFPNLLGVKNYHFELYYEVNGDVVYDDEGYPDPFNDSPTRWMDCWSQLLFDNMKALSAASRLQDIKIDIHPLPTHFESPEIDMDRAMVCLIDPFRRLRADSCKIKKHFGNHKALTRAAKLEINDNDHMLPNVHNTSASSFLSKTSLIGHDFIRSSASTIARNDM